MIIVISPAKKLDFITPIASAGSTTPNFIEHSAQLIAVLRQYEPVQLANLMHLSDELASLNVARYAQWSVEPEPSTCRQAVFAYNGAVYQALGASTMPSHGLAFAQRHLRILSGLYGVLRPLDLIQAHRLEMGSRLPTSRGKNLYEFWGDIVTDSLNAELHSTSSNALINLASEEYFRAVRPSRLRAQVITPVFEEVKGGKVRTVAIHAKKARGLMARYVVMNGITDPEDIKQFDGGGYSYDESASSEVLWRFRRSTVPLQSIRLAA